MFSSFILLCFIEISFQTSSVEIFKFYSPKMCEVCCTFRENCNFDEVHLGCQLVSNTTSIGTTYLPSTESDLDFCNITNNFPMATENKVNFQKSRDCPVGIVRRFLKACQTGLLRKVKRLLSRGSVDVNCRGENGETAVMMAAWYGNEKIFDFLVQQNCNISDIDEGNDTVTHFACMGGNRNIVEKLLDNNMVDIESRRKDGSTPLMAAVDFGKLSVVKLLRYKGANIKTTDFNNNNILHIACMSGHVNMVKYVLALNLYDIDCRGEKGRTPLMLVTHFGHFPVLEFLREKGADINTKDDYGNTILHMASMGGNVRIVRYILSLRMNALDCKGEFGRTPLMVAVQMNEILVVKVLRRKGAVMMTTDDNNNNVLHLACVGGHVRLVKYILHLNLFDIDCKGEAGRTPLMYTASQGHMPIFKLLQQNKANLTVTDDLGSNLFHVACLAGQLDMVKYLVTLEAMRGFEIRNDRKGDTPVRLAELKGNCDIVKYLKSKL